MSCLLKPLPSTPVEDLEGFIRSRWLQLGGSGGLDGIEAAGGPAANTIRKLAQSPGTTTRRSDTRDKLAVFLRFRDWDELWEAFEADDVRHGLNWVRLSDVAFAIAQRAARERNLRVDEWVNARIEELASATTAGRAK